MIGTDYLQHEHGGEFIQEFKRGNIRQCRMMLDKDKMLAFEKDVVGHTMLHTAAKRNAHEMMYEILDYKGDLNGMDIGGKTPLHHAVHVNSTYCTSVSESIDTCSYFWLLDATPSNSELIFLR